MTLSPITNAEAQYQGLEVLTHDGTRVYISSTGNYLRDAACALHWLREHSYNIEPLPITLSMAIPKMPATIASEVMP